MHDVRRMPVPSDCRRCYSTQGIRENVINVGRVGGWILGCICSTQRARRDRPDGEESTMKNMRRFVIAGVLSALMMAGFGARPGMAQPRTHVYLLRGLMNIFSLGMDTLAS
jgi:hypothetical protein